MYKIPQKKAPLKQSNEGMTNSQYKKYRNWVHQNRGCVVCGSFAANHHITHKSIEGNRRKHERTVALCYDHHQGDMGIHRLNEEWYETFIALDDLIDMADEQYSDYLKECYH